MWPEAKEMPIPLRERGLKQVYKGVGLWAEGFIYLCSSAPPTIPSTYWEVMNMLRGGKPHKGKGVYKLFSFIKLFRPTLESTQFAEQVIKT